MNIIRIVAAFGTVAVVVSMASPASAREIYDGSSSHRATSVSSPYATPLAALGGVTLGQYLAERQAAVLSARS